MSIKKNVFTFIEEKVKCSNALDIEIFFANDRDGLGIIKQECNSCSNQKSQIEMYRGRIVNVLHLN